MPTLRIHGGKSLHGTLSVSPAKNAAVALLSASLLIKGKVTFYDVPRIQEVERFSEILQSIGVIVQWVYEHTLSLDTKGPLKLADIHKKASSSIRSSLLLFGALAAREHSYRLYKSG